MQAGDMFPHFVLQDENGEKVDSDALRGVRYVIYFYSKDNTPGCTKEAVEFTGLYPKFMLRNVPIFGVSGDSPETHRKFRESQGLKVKLLSDPDHALAKEVVGNIRSTFIVGRDGVVEEAWTNVKAGGHAQKVLDAMLSHFRDDEPMEF